MKKTLFIIFAMIVAFGASGCKKSLPPNATQEFCDIGKEMSKNLNYYLNDEMDCDTLHDRAAEALGEMQELWNDKTKDQQKEAATDNFLMEEIDLIVSQSLYDYEKYRARESKETIDSYLDKGFYATMDEKD